MFMGVSRAVHFRPRLKGILLSTMPGKLYQLTGWLRPAADDKLTRASRSPNGEALSEKCFGKILFFHTRLKLSLAIRNCLITFRNVIARMKYMPVS